MRRQSDIPDLPKPKTKSYVNSKIGPANYKKQLNGKYRSGAHATSHPKRVDFVTFTGWA